MFRPACPTVYEAGMANALMSAHGSAQATVCRQGPFRFQSSWMSS